MNSLSIAMIAHNEATNIKQALDSVAWADQVVVVDAGSTDDTAEIARKNGAEVHKESNKKNLNINKNISIDHCTSDWVLILDADEQIPDSLTGEIRRTINEVQHDGYLIPRSNVILGRGLRHGGQYPDYQLRLFRRNKGRFPAKHVHERLKVEGSVGKLKIPFNHYPYRDLNEMMRKGLFYAEFEAQYLLDNGKTVSSSGLIVKAITKPIIRFIRRYIFKGGFLDGVPGLVTALFDAWNQSVRWLRLWDMQRDFPK